MEIFVILAVLDGEKQSQTKPIAHSTVGGLKKQGLKKSLSSHATGRQKMSKLWITAEKPNRMDVNIYRKLELPAKTWYFIQIIVI